MKSKLTAAEILYIGLGGMLGSLLRWWIGLGYDGAFPVPTVMINILGAAALGVLYAAEHRLHLHGKYLYMVGFCGSFTTVSLFSYESVLLFERGALWEAGLNLILPVMVSLVIVATLIRTPPSGEGRPSK